MRVRSAPEEDEEYEDATSVRPQAMPSNHVATPSNHVVMPLNRVATPLNHIAMPSNRVSTPFNHVAMPPNHVAIPSNHVATTSDHQVTPSMQGNSIVVMPQQSEMESRHTGSALRERNTSAVPAAQTPSQFQQFNFDNIVSCAVT